MNKAISENQIYLLVQLLKKKIRECTNETERRNLICTKRAYDKLLTSGIKKVITKYSTETEKNG